MHNSLEDECGRDLPMVEWERIRFGGVSRKDEKETGLGATLNLGHTFGYAIEAKGGNGQWLHGVAVAADMVMTVDLSHRLGWIDDSSVQRVHAILKQANLPTVPPENMTVDMFKSVMMIREKVEEGTSKLILLRGPLGNCVVTGDYDRNMALTLRCTSSVNLDLMPGSLHSSFMQLSSYLLFLCVILMSFVVRWNSLPFP